ncbi:MAG: hypothetical protein WD361_04320 [Gracilimonas sp.]
MHSDYSRDKIISQLKDEWLKEAKQLMLNKLSEDTQKFGEIINKALKTIEGGEIEKAFNALIEKLKPGHQKKLPEDEDDNKSEEYNSEWISQLREISANISKEVLLTQEEARFTVLPGDSPNTIAGKFIKGSAFSVQKGFNSAGNNIRSIWNGKQKPEPAWKHKVPLKNIVELNLLGVFNWIQNWNDELEKLEAEMLLEADAWILHSTGLIKYIEESDSDSKSDNDAIEEKEKGEAQKTKNIPDENDIEVFFNEASAELAELKTNYSQKLDELLLDLEQNIIEGISLTGTIERSASEYSNSEITRKENSVTGIEKRNAETWNELQIALINRVYLSMSFKTLYEQVGERVTGFSESVNEFFSNNIEKPQQELGEQLDKAISIFDESEHKSIKEVRELSSKQRDQMNEHIELKLLKPIRKIIEDADLSTKLDRFTSAIPEWTKNLQEKATLIETLDLGKLPPKYEFEKVDWQVLVQRVINNHLAKEFMPKEVKPEQFMMEVLQGFQEISQIIYTNLEIADEVKKSDEEEPFEVAKKGLERAKTKLNELSEKVYKKRDELVTKLAGKREAAFSKLAMLLEKQDVNEIRMAGAEYMAKERAIDWKTKLQVKWAEFEETAELFGRFLWKKTKQYFGTIKKLLGFAEKEKLEGDKTDLATFLSETDDQIASLPFIYRRLFDFNKEVEDRFYIRRPEQFERFKKGYELWQNNFPSTFAIVGEKGSGKSLFINLLMEDVLKKHEVIEINFQETIWKPEQVIEKVSSALNLDDISTTEELIDAIGRKKKRIVVILENIQNCYIRNISGFEAIEQLLYLISETNKKVLWITSSTRYGWLFLDKVLNLADYFTHTVQTDHLNEQQIEDLILRRHRASGYQLKFLPDEAIKKSRTFRKLMDNEEKTQEFLMERYFEKLAKLAEGNSSIAMIYWIRSIKDFDDTHFIIKPFEFGAINRIEELESPELFALAAFILHDSLNPEELSQIMHQPVRESKVMISRLTSRSILYKTDYGYMLNHLIYRQVVRVLKEANFIH